MEEKKSMRESEAKTCVEFQEMKEIRLKKIKRENGYL